MRQYDEKNLVIRRGDSRDPDVLVEVTPEKAGWSTLAFQARRLAAGHSWSRRDEDRETALVVLGGRLDVSSGRDRWGNIGERPHVFAGLPHALYFPSGAAFSVTAVTDCEFAVASVPADGGLAPRLVEPRDIAVEIRGGDHATRQINSILPPGFPCRRLVVVEVYTPGGNWSSYPPHKHDVHRPDAAGRLI
jgi:5-deoxy-glucuronate isomerase